jgi:hypothetical protein
MRRFIPLMIIATALLASTVSYAHHSYGATYDVSKSIKLEGKLVQFIFRNPHAYVSIEVPDENGKMQRWAVEWSGTTQLGAQGVNSATLKVGDQIVILGRPSRVPNENRALMVTLKRPSDGFTWGAREGERVD